MSKSTTRYHDPLNLKKNGCVRTLVILGIIAGGIMFLGIQYITKNAHKLHQPQTMLKDIRLALSSYELDYGHYPIPESDWHGPDVSIRTRGPMLTGLIGSNATLNPKDIKFIDFPAAKDRKFGLWQDGEEWVLSDPWGEPYYITLDTNKDGKVANPEPQGENIPATFATAIILYSSGPDRDPKTWKDNVCSWYSR
jgi:type II secretory pathway pseudopilin PulG